MDTGQTNSALGKFSALSSPARRSFIVAVFELLLARLRLAALSPGKFLGSLRTPLHDGATTPARPSRQPDIATVSWALAAAANRVPWRADCLVQAAAADRWLRRLGHAPQFHLGVDHPDPDDFSAHAWIVVNDTVVTGGNPDRFTLLVGPHTQPDPM